jgi:hypothetical protein
VAFRRNCKLASIQTTFFAPHKNPPPGKNNKDRQMLNEIDLFAVGFLLFAFWDGWRVGLMRSILSPLCFAFFVIIAIINFDLNFNIAVASLIAVIGTTVTSAAIRLALWLGRRTVDKEFRQYIFWGSRLCGAATSVGWKSFVAAIALLLFAIIPVNFMPGTAQLQKSILFSRAFFYTDQIILKRFPRAQKVYLVLSVLKDATQNQELAQNSEFKAFFASPKVQEFINDRDIQSFLSERDYPQIVTHPRLRAIITDDQLMATLMRSSRQIYKEKFKEIKRD